ncbi:MAG: helix-turn-helix domain-containing protein [Chitinophagales bacterium]|nr:helix-turn-helix domain-containing protein [Chitinophagales bacterium]
MNTYHLDLLQKHLKKALERYCQLCDFSPDRQYYSNETTLSQTKEIVQQYIRLFQTLNFLDRQTEYYHHGFIFTDQETEEEITAGGEYREIIKLFLEAYQHIAESALKDRFFLPVHVQQINSEEIQIFVGVVTKDQHHYEISVVAHQTVYPRPYASIGNNRYLYLIKLLESYNPDEKGTLQAFIKSNGLSYRQITKDSTAFFESTFYHHYLKIKMIPALEDLMLSTLSYKEIAYKNGFANYHQLYTLFHKTYHFPLNHIPRIALKM